MGRLGERGSRRADEPPRGEDLESARVLNRDLLKHLAESQIYRIDHYLGKETVQNILAMRFANNLFEPIWNSNYVDHVQITMAEDIGIGGRAGYYDGIGAARDVIQNHLLQLMCLVAMEEPTSFDAESLRIEKQKVLRSVVLPKRLDLTTARGQYAAGWAGGEKVAGFLEEEGIAKASTTETFAAVTLGVDTRRWAGVPFYLRTGKRMPERKTEIFIQFKCVPHSMFEARGATTKPNKLVISIQPEENIRLMVMAKTPGLDRDGLRLREVPLDIDMDNAFADKRRRIAYERLLLDLIEGDPTLFVRRDEVEAQWQWIDGVRSAWAEAKAAPLTYSAGSRGPSAASALTRQDGVQWHD